jgi:hypothetical protein
MDQNRRTFVKGLFSIGAICSLSSIKAFSSNKNVLKTLPPDIATIITVAQFAMRQRLLSLCAFYAQSDSPANTIAWGSITSFRTSSIKRSITCSSVAPRSSQAASSLVRFIAPIKVTPVPYFGRLPTARLAPKLRAYSLAKDKFTPVSSKNRILLCNERALVFSRHSRGNCPTLSDAVNLK